MKVLLVPRDSLLSLMALAWSNAKSRDTVEGCVWRARAFRICSGTRDTHENHNSLDSHWRRA